MVKKKNSTKKKCIYLDQFSVSDMIEADKTSIWFEIKTKLFELYKNELIFCPLSTEHYFETSQKNIQGAKKHDEFLSKLSDGYCIKPELFITSQLISSRIRNNNVTLKTYMYENVKNRLDSQANYDTFDELSKQLQNLVSDAASDINQLRQSTNKQKMDLKTKEIMLNTIKKIEPRKFIYRLKELNKMSKIIIKGDLIAGKSIPNWIDLTIDQLLRKHVFTKNEVEKLILEFEKFGFQNIPTLDIKFSLMALMSVYSKGEKPSDHIDLMRIANGLPISDYLFTDRRRKAELVESNLPNKYNTKIFSGTKDDLEDFLVEISKI
jgi:hypothetical protein